MTRLEALARVICSNRWKVMSFTLQQAELFEAELRELGYQLVPTPHYEARPEVLGDPLHGVQLGLREEPRK